MAARETALNVLTRMRTQGAWSDGALQDAIARDELSPRDAALCTVLVSGVLQNRALLDCYVDGLLAGKGKIRPLLRDILRIGAYQILFLDRVPDSAAVNAAVEQAKRQLSRQESGLCNGLLRNLSRKKENLSPPKDYAIRYSHPSELVNLMKQSLGKRLQPVLEADNTAPELCAQWNPLRGTEQKLLAAWEQEGVEFAPHSWMKGCYTLKHTGAPATLDSFRTGRFQIQDPAARLAVDVMALEPGMDVLDLCAAPGGKSLAAAASMENRGSILSCDLHEGKLPQITRAAERLGVGIITVRQNDAARFCPVWEERFDAVLADVPCSGLGVIRKKPEIRYKSLKEMEALPSLQLEILRQASRYVRPGGALLYSTCTILRRENEDVVRAFLAENCSFEPEALPLPEPLSEQETGMLTLYQGIHDCDGFFLCKLRRRETEAH